MRADMVPNDPVMLRRLTQMICLSDLTQQTACLCVSYIQRMHARHRSRTETGRTGCERCCAAALMDCRGWSAVRPAGGCWAAPGARGAAKDASGGTTLGLNETHRCDALTSVY